LMRNPERYSDSLQLSTLEEVRHMLEIPEKKPETLDLTGYFNDDMLNMLDELLKTDGHYFLENVLKALLQFNSIKTAIPRLGLGVEVFENYVQILGMELNSHIDEWLVPMLLNSFMLALQDDFIKIDEIAVFVYLCKVPLKGLLLKNEVSEKDIQA